MNKDKNDLPLGFGMALAQNTDAMKAFSSTSESEQQKILQQAHSVNSKEAMSALVDSLAKQQNNF